MKSRITVDFKGLEGTTGTSQFEPVLRVHLEQSDDVRDGLMNSFFEALGYRSNWLRVDFLPQDDGTTKAIIYPVKPDELESTIETLKERLEN